MTNMEAGFNSLGGGETSLFLICIWRSNPGPDNLARWSYQEVRSLRHLCFSRASSPSTEGVAIEKDQRHE